ncbi:hypothetical protein TWF730_011145 [Orbilia blumenaviensis]|uniref:FAD-binding PCMH-type domain-containing protein n=1 Tax=Orbilia blumenaviensis TaxID=1796055 RepID=A0AAV9UN02_9PEZI
MLSHAAILLGFGLVLQTSAFGIQFTSPTTCCSLLGTEFNGESKVFSVTSTEYGSLNTYWTPAAQQTPTCIFTPADTQDVSRAVKLFTRKNCQFAIRSGGHSYNPGWAGIVNGVLISLSDIDDVTYDSGTGLASVGAGSRWTNVYEALLPYNVTVLGGRNSNLGVGGYLTGGGISFYANERGWAADNIHSVEIVLAGGKVITASRTQHSELFRCIKGGSNNYGVITKFVLETIDASNPFNGFAVDFPPTSTDSLLAGAYNYCTGGSDADPKSHIIFAAAITGNLPYRDVLLMSYNGVFDTASSSPAIRPFFDGTIPGPTVRYFASNGTIKQATDRLSVIQAPGTRYTMGTLSIYADLELFKTLRSIWQEETTSTLRAKSGFMTEFAFQPVGSKWLASSAARGGNSMGITRPFVVVWVQPRWDLAVDDAEMVAYTDRVISRCEQAAKTANKFSKFKYLNYGGRNQEIITHYGAPSVLRMQINKLRYDPLNVFGRLVPGGFKIPGF